MNTVSGTLLHIKARTISSTDSCKLIVLANGNIKGIYYDSVDTDITVEFKIFDIVFQATDKNNLSTESSPIRIYLETSPHLKEIYQVEDHILDFNYNKLLVVKGDFNPRIIDINNGVTNAIPLSDPITQGYLTPQGAVLGSITPTNGTLYEFNNSNIIPLGKYRRGAMKVAGSYCMWAKTGIGGEFSNDTIFLKNTSTGELNTITNNAFSLIEPYEIQRFQLNSDVSEDGTVAYIDALYIAPDPSKGIARLMKYKKGIYSQINQYSLSRHYPSVKYPITDGNYIARFEEDINSSHSYLSIENQVYTLFSGVTQNYPQDPNTWYQVANKHCAYFDITKQGVNQFTNEIHIIDSFSNRMLIDVTSSSRFKLDLFNDKRDLMYFIGDQYGISYVRNLALFNNTNKHISSDLGKSFYRGSIWYIAIGRSLFKVDFEPAQNVISNSSVFISKDSTYLFKATDFSTHFDGPGKPLSIKIISLPINGRITKSGIPINPGEEISISEIDQLRYIPGTGYLGNESIQWNASDGYSYALANANLTLKVQAKPDQPVLIGLSDSYCNTAGQQKIKIANYPVPLSGYAVNVSLDSNYLVVTSADSSFSFNTNAYPPGNHMIKTVFTNIAGSTIDTAYIFIKSEVTPIVRVSSNITNVTDLTLPVTVTATNYEGGGSSPYYSFAKNNSFTDILQPEGTNNKLVMNPSTLSIGNNWIFVRMKTSETCYAVQFAVDSVNITRDAVTGIIDPENPDKVITVNPNPFRNTIFIGGLNPAKKYTFSLFQVTGQRFNTRKTSGSSNITIDETSIAPGLYFLTIFDASKGRTLGTIKLLKE